MPLSAFLDLWEWKATSLGPHMAFLGVCVRKEVSLPLLLLGH